MTGFTHVTALISLTSGAAQGSRAAPETDPRHVLEVCPAPGAQGPVPENKGHGGEVRGSWRSWRDSPEEASGEEGPKGQLGKSCGLLRKKMGSQEIKSLSNL